MKRILSLTLIAFVFTVMSGCQPELRRADVSSNLIKTEESKQKALAAKVRRERQSRINKVARPLLAESRKICRYIKGDTTSKCVYPIKLMADDTLNASADGDTVYINAGMLRFTGNDNELAFIIGHEISHNILGHRDKKIGGLLIGAFFDALAGYYGKVDTQGAFAKAGANAYSKEYESESDYLSLYLLARAGYDIKEAPEFWRRMAIESPESITGKFSTTHPGHAERFAAMDAAIKEIEKKITDNDPLIPNKADEVDNEQEIADSVPPPSSSAVDLKKSITKTSVNPKPKIQKVGLWSYNSMKKANEIGCKSDDGSSASYTFEAVGFREEIYTFSCQQGENVKINCSSYGCSKIN